MPPLIRNPEAKRLFLARQGLSQPPRRKLTAAGLHDLIEALGFVQVDSINTVARAHHMILFARNQTYRPAQLTRLLERRSLPHGTRDHVACDITRPDRLAGSGCGLLPRGVGNRRQQHLEGGSRTRVRKEANPAVVAGHDGVSHGQSQPAAQLLGGEVRVEHLLAGVGRDPGTAIRHAEIPLFLSQ